MIESTLEPSRQNGKRKSTGNWYSDRLHFQQMRINILRCFYFPFNLGFIKKLRINLMITRTNEEKREECCNGDATEIEIWTVKFVKC